MIYQILREARRVYDVPETFVEDIGAVRYPSADEVRRLHYLMHRREPRRPGSGGELVALGILGEAERRILARYRAEAARDPLEAAAVELSAGVGRDTLRSGLEAFGERFPPRSPAGTEGSQAAALLAEVLLVTVSNRNPACLPWRELHTDRELRSQPAYAAVAAGLEGWSGRAAGGIAAGGGILELLMEPIRHAPNSLLEQLRYLRSRWAELLGDILDLIDLALDILREETRLRVGGPPAGPVPLPAYEDLAHDGERYSHDVAWMPSLVLIAKHALVWLYQLSRRHGRPIRRLDEIPDEALDELEDWGITGLWLIGIWRRSPASRVIKQRCGNPEAVGSAYAIVDYRIEDSLGGEEAVAALAARCARRGIRMACDMVPNHTALDSTWVRHHPDWFVGSDTPPFPSYTWRGDPVTQDPGLDLRIEDHYYDRSDAAVVFRREDRATGAVRYIYHGNDGTSTPWNDTAQLDFLRADVREEVIRRILDVARQFPVIRFDAAMVLTRKHFQRLWYPPLGAGGDIPSRAGQGVSDEEFRRRMPLEFWREVVDRVAAEVPGTLLLAEAFWLLEGYFVRTLGMHRVYNSAFMNMLKTEDNAGYRKLIASTLEFDPEILKRYVNFMSNPDEEPAAVQFGGGDKYFGVAVLMATLPGLPMFGHGQMEGAAEKYGMEYARSYRDTPPDPGFLERHRREIHPLLKLRPLFAEVGAFRLYDLVSPGGGVDEDVLAYSNRRGPAFALVVYNNRYRHAEGHITLCAPYRDRARGQLVRRHLAEEIGLYDDPAYYVVFRDHSSGLEYIRSSRGIHAEGLRISLGAFQYNVFLDFREIRDNRLGHYARADASLDGRGVRSLEEVVAGYREPVRRALKELLEAAAAGGGPRIAAGRAALGEALAVCCGPAGLGAADSTPGPGPRKPPRRRAPGVPAWLPLVLELRAALSADRQVVAMEDLRLPDVLRACLGELGFDAVEAGRAAALLWILWAQRALLYDGETVLPPGPQILEAPGLRVYLGVNWFDGFEWLRREPFEDLMSALALECAPGAPARAAIARARAAVSKGEYRLDRIVSHWKTAPAARSAKRTQQRGRRRKT